MGDRRPPRRLRLGREKFGEGHYHCGGVANATINEALRQHRTIRREVSDRIFAPIQSLENEGILYVFLVFQTEEVGQKDG